MATDTKKNSPANTSKNKEKLNKLFDQQDNDSQVSDDSAAKVVPDNGQSLEMAMKVEALEKELAQEKENTLRIQADLQNRLKRKDQEKENALRFAQEKFFKDFLLVLDSIDGALMHDQQVSAEQLKEGLVMISSQLESLLGPFKLESITPEIGSMFSPETAEAISMQPSDEHPHNAVLAVVQKGYSYQGRVIRPARVVVSQKLEDNTLEKQ